MADGRIAGLVVTGEMARTLAATLAGRGCEVQSPCGSDPAVFKASGLGRAGRLTFPEESVRCTAIRVAPGRSARAGALVMPDQCTTRRHRQFTTFPAMA